MSKWKKPWLFRCSFFFRELHLDLSKMWFFKPVKVMKNNFIAAFFLWDLLKLHIGNLGGGNSKIFYFVTSIFFKLGWFNHQREIHSLKRPTKALCASNQQDYVFIDGLGLKKKSAPMKNWEGGKVAFWESIHNSSSFFLGMCLSWRSLIF